MTLDLSYINEVPSEAQEEAVKKAVEQECIRAIATYLNEVADAMDANSIETLNVPSLRAMANELSKRLENGESANEEN
jgi:hypothetical protein